MHIPDGFLDPGVAAVAGVVSAGAVAYGLRRAEASLDDRTVPLAGCDGGVRLRGPDAQLPGRRRHERPSPGSGAGRGPARAVARLSGALGRAHGPGARVRGRRDHRPGREHPEHGRRRGAAHRRAHAPRPPRAARPPRPCSSGSSPSARGSRSWAARSPRRSSSPLSGIPLGTVLPPMLGVHALIGIGEAVVTVAAVSAVLVSRADLVAALRGTRLAASGG